MSSIENRLFFQNNIINSNSILFNSQLPNQSIISFKKFEDLSPDHNNFYSINKEIESNYKNYFNDNKRVSNFEILKKKLYFFTVRYD